LTATNTAIRALTTTNASDIATQTARIDLINTNLTATNTAIRALNTSTQSALDTQEAKQASDLANTNAFITSVQSSIASGAALGNTNLAITQLNTNLTATNTAIRLLNTNTQSALDTQEAKQASDLANTNTFITSTQGNIDTQTARINLLNTNLTSTNTAIRSVITSEVNGLIDSAPGALDTLNELAAALGDDENFSTTVTNSIATKLASANVAVYTANTNGIAQPLSTVQMSDNSVLVDPAGHLTINLGGTNYKIPYFS
jgi:chromosome segregation ATPase